MASLAGCLQSGEGCTHGLLMHNLSGIILIVGFLEKQGLTAKDPTGIFQGCQQNAPYTKLFKKIFFFSFSVPFLFVNRTWLLSTAPNIFLPTLDKIPWVCPSESKDPTCRILDRGKKEGLGIGGRGFFIEQDEGRTCPSKQESGQRRHITDCILATEDHTEWQRKVGAYAIV